MVHYESFDQHSNVLQGWNAYHRLHEPRTENKSCHSYGTVNLPMRCDFICFHVPSSVADAKNLSPTKICFSLSNTMFQNASSLASVTQPDWHAMYTNGKLNGRWPGSLYARGASSSSFVRPIVQQVLHVTIGNQPNQNVTRTSLDVTRWQFDEQACGRQSFCYEGKLSRLVAGFLYCRHQKGHDIKTLYQSVTYNVKNFTSATFPNTKNFKATTAAKLL